MKIIQDPKDWKDLQNKVGEILKQCNFEVEIEKTIKSIRSEIEIDVYAEEKVDGREYTILCECKMWNSNIPQLYVHGLRTVVNDIGANKGYIISKKGFQKGAIKSIENTNIELLNWEEFQKKYYKSWYLNYFSKKMSSIFYSDYDENAINFYDDFTKIKKEDYRDLIDKLRDLRTVENHFPSCYIYNIAPNQYEYFDYKLPLIDKLELEEYEKSYFSVPNEIMKEEYYDKFLELISKYTKDIYTELNKLDINSSDYD